jgi:hypothetical protein
MFSWISSRRTALKLALALPITGLVGVALNKVQQKITNPLNQEFLFSAQGRDSKQYGLGWIDNINEPDQAANYNVPSQFRGHGICQNPNVQEQIVMMSRRPGLHGLVFNLDKKMMTSTFSCKAGHHFQGHSCFSNDGEYLYSTESNSKTGEGLISVRETKTFQQVTQFESHGIGPHQIELMPDGDTLVIANGGLLTLPESGREILNLATMDSSLTYINRHTGDLISQHRLTKDLINNDLDMNKASIRHLDVAADGSVVMGLQVQRIAMKNDQLLPLAAIHKNNQLQLLTAPNNLIQQLNDYMGSVKVNNQTRTVGYTSPRGNLAVFWSLDDLSLQAFHNFHDVCGLSLSADNKYFILSNSAGKIRFIDSKLLTEDKTQRLYFANQSWDNHMLNIHLTS